MQPDAKTRKPVTAALLTLLCVFASSGPASAVPEAPPEAVLRDLVNTPRIARGTSVTLEQTTVTIALQGQPPRDALAEAVLFLPDRWQDTVTSQGSVRLTLHFHGAPWFAIEEHARRGVEHPLLAFYLGEGSSMYQRPFEDAGRLPRFLDAATAEMAARGAPHGLRFAPLEVQSFSAGYGAVRELLKSDVWQERIERIVLADSLYASLTTATVETAGEGATGTTASAQVLIPDPDQMAPFIRFAKRARTTPGRQFLLAHCELETRTYASTRRTADTLIEALGGRHQCESPSPLPGPPPPGSRFGLRRQCSMGGFHIWSYDGVDGKAHMAIARTIAEYWKALDADPPPALRP